MNRAGDGYPAFQKTMGLNLRVHECKWFGVRCFKNKKLDVAVGYSTDGRIAAYDLKILKMIVNSSHHMMEVH